MVVEQILECRVPVGSDWCAGRCIYPQLLVGKAVISSTDVCVLIDYDQVPSVYGLGLIGHSGIAALAF